MRRSKKKYDEVSYWESMTDSMIGLLLCILLLSVLLILYMVWSKDNIKDTGDLETTQTTVATPIQIASYIDIDYGDGNGKYDDYSEGGGGNGDGETQEQTTHLYDDPDPGDGEASEKAAVFVQVVDKETQRTLKQEGIQFELYTNSALKTLFTYYPDKIEYNEFETDENGEFFLPEKVKFATYRFHCISDIKGYDTPDDKSFRIKKEYDWDAPYVVTIEVSPAKNKVIIQLNDKDDGTAITGASFNVVAEDDIITADGTVRYRKGDIASTITLDENGYGESEEIFLGKYSIEQDEIPEYYAPVADDVQVEVLSKKSASATTTNKISESKTTAEIQVNDELYENTPIAGAKFKVQTQDGKSIGTYTTDAKGKFTLRDLTKNTTYKIEQISTIDKYRVNTDEFTFTVSGDGLIEEEPSHEITIPNRMIRLTVGLQDYIFKNQVSDVNIAICDLQENIIKSWNTTGIAQQIEDIEPGEYFIIIDGKTDEAQKITISDTATIQEFSYKKVTLVDIFSGIGAVVGVIGIIVGIVFLLRHLLTRKKKEK